MPTITKTGLISKKLSDNTFRFILSNEQIDRDGDIIMSDGWDLKDFRKNPVALAYHDSTKIVGKWHNVKVVNKELQGDLELAPDDVGSLQRAINRLVDGGFLKAVSVGFRGLQTEPIETGIKFLKQSLFECSLVAVGSNSGALAIAKSCDLKQSEIDQIFTRLSGDDSICDSAETIKSAKQAILKTNKLLRRK